MVSRKSSITNAFVGSIIPVFKPTEEEIAEALDVLGMRPDDVRCTYCGDKSTEWDHLRPLVKDRRPTGYISEIANLVPSCGKCNQSKGNSNWREWMMSAADRSPKARGVADVEERKARLEAYEQWKPATKVNFVEILGAAELEEYWSLCDQVNQDMKKAQEVATSLKLRVLKAVKPR
jgi:hypothetical protein